MNTTQIFGMTLFGAMELLPIAVMLFVVWLIFRPRVHKPSTLLTKILKIIGAGVLYLFVGSISVMATDSCTSGNCPIEIWLMVGYAWLMGSFLVFAYLVFTEKVFASKLLQIFYPYLALPIFVLLLTGGFLLGGT